MFKSVYLSILWRLEKDETLGGQMNEQVGSIGWGG